MALAVAAENGGEKDAVEATVTDVKDDDAKKDEARQLEKEAEAEKERVGESDKTSMPTHLPNPLFRAAAAAAAAAPDPPPTPDDLEENPEADKKASSSSDDDVVIEAVITSEMRAKMAKEALCNPGRIRLPKIMTPLEVREALDCGRSSRSVKTNKSSAYHYYSPEDDETSDSSSAMEIAKTARRHRRSEEEEEEDVPLARKRPQKKRRRQPISHDVDSSQKSHAESHNSLVGLSEGDFADDDDDVIPSSPPSPSPRHKLGSSCGGCARKGRNHACPAVTVRLDRRPVVEHLARAETPRVLLDRGAVGRWQRGGRWKLTSEEEEEYSYEFRMEQPSPKSRKGGFRKKLSQSRRRRREMWEMEGESDGPEAAAAVRRKSDKRDHRRRKGSLASSRIWSQSAPAAAENSDSGGGEEEEAFSYDEAADASASSYVEMFVCDICKTQSKAAPDEAAFDSNDALKAHLVDSHFRQCLQKQITAALDAKTACVFPNCGAGFADRTSAEEHFFGSHNALDNLSRPESDRRFDELRRRLCPDCDQEHKDAAAMADHCLKTHWHWLDALMDRYKMGKTLKPLQVPNNGVANSSSNAQLLKETAIKKARYLHSPGRGVGKDVKAYVGGRVQSLLKTSTTSSGVSVPAPAAAAPSPLRMFRVFKDSTGTRIVQAHVSELRAAVTPAGRPQQPTRVVILNPAPAASSSRTSSRVPGPGRMPSGRGPVDELMQKTAADPSRCALCGYAPSRPSLQNLLRHVLHAHFQLELKRQIRDQQRQKQQQQGGGSPLRRGLCPRCGSMFEEDDLLEHFAIDHRKIWKPYYDRIHNPAAAAVVISSKAVSNGVDRPLTIKYVDDWDCETIYDLHPSAARASDYNSDDGAGSKYNEVKREIQPLQQRQSGGVGANDPERARKDRMFQRLEYYRRHRPGKAFVQQQACFEIAGLQPGGFCHACLSHCRRQTPEDEDSLCQFDGFRKLAYIRKTGYFTPSGFLDPDTDPDERDQEIWEPVMKFVPRGMDIKSARFILENIGAEFVAMVEEEEATVAAYAERTGGRRPIWKRMQEKTREMCDVCSTSLFNVHWTCQKCGVLVCIDCYAVRRKGETAYAGQANLARPYKSRRRKTKNLDDHLWPFCKERETHKLDGDSLLLTKMIGGDSVSTLKELVKTTMDSNGIVDAKKPLLKLQRAAAEAATLAASVKPSPAEVKMEVEEAGNKSESSCSASGGSDDDEDTTNFDLGFYTVCPVCPGEVSLAGWQADRAQEHLIEHFRKELTDALSGEQRASEAGDGQCPRCDEVADEDDLILHFGVDHGFLAEYTIAAAKKKRTAKNFVYAFQKAQTCKFCDMSFAERSLDTKGIRTHLLSHHDFRGSILDVMSGQSKSGGHYRCPEYGCGYATRDRRMMSDNHLSVYHGYLQKLWDEEELRPKQAPPETVVENGGSKRKMVSVDAAVETKRVKTEPASPPEEKKKKKTVHLYQYQRDVGMSKVAEQHKQPQPDPDEISALIFESSSYFECHLCGHAKTKEAKLKAHVCDHLSQMADLPRRPPFDCEACGEACQSRTELLVHTYRRHQKKRTRENGYSHDDGRQKRKGNGIVVAAAAKELEEKDQLLADCMPIVDEEADCDFFDVVASPSAADAAESSPSQFDQDMSNLKAVVPQGHNHDLSGRKYPGVGHQWLCDGKLLLLKSFKVAEARGLFQEQWLRGQPVVIADSCCDLDPDLWSPESFLRDFGRVRHTLINCLNGNEVPKAKLADFWEGFQRVTKRLKDEKGTPMLLKLKDWPPTDDIAEYMPRRFNDLMSSLPMAEYTLRSGKLNLAGYMPDYFLRPELGPKMYIAYGSALYSDKGSTNLHIDMSDAVNCLVYVGVPKDCSVEEQHKEVFKEVDKAGCDVLTKQRVHSPSCKPGALWHIFHPGDTVKIRDLLKRVAVEKKKRLDPHDDPIHDQSTYLDGPLRMRLYKEYGVQGYAIVQCEGDTVFIPAGAAHQVRNLHNCIKIAEDFVSPENTSHCLHLTQEFRHLTDWHTNHEDKLQIKNIIYHAAKCAVTVLRDRRKKRGRRAKEANSSP